MNKIGVIVGVGVCVGVIVLGGALAYNRYFAQQQQSVVEKVVVPEVVEEKVKSADSFVPTGWGVLANIRGDLNKDGLNDVVIVAENGDYKNKDGSPCGETSCPRKLLVLLQEKNGGYVLSAESDKAILLADEGGVFGDPFDGIKIENGSFLINFYGGSNWRWSNSYRFRYQDGGWFMIGATSFNYFNVVDCVDKKVDYNFLTGKKQTITSNKWDTYLDDPEGWDAKPCVRPEVWADIANNELINLNNFKASDFVLLKF